MLFADLTLARRIEAAMARANVDTAEAYGRCRPDAGVAVAAIAGGHAVFQGRGSTLSQAQGLGLNGPVSAADFEQLEAFYAARGVRVQLEVCTLADPTLWEQLGARGYRPTEPSHVLVRPIAAGEPWGAPPEGLSVERVRVDEPEPFASTVMAAFFEAPAVLPDDMVDAVRTSLEVPSVLCWLARVGGTPAGGATMFVTDGLALFAGDGVLRPFRGRGVHAALLRARLAQAEALACDMAVTCTEPGSVSQRNAERLGFQMAYARMLFVRECA